MNSNNFHIPSLDGIRCVSIMLVYLGHIGLISFGTLGVTIFFFLSGFLITTLLRKEFQKSKDIDIKSFFIRRFLRIFPSFYAVLTISLLFHVLFEQQVSLWPILLQYLHLTNYASLYFNSELILGSLVYWSLSVEEHFYLLFPLIYLFFLKKNYSKYKITYLLLLLCLLILINRIYLIHYLDSGSARVYRSTDTRIDSILFGCILAIRLNPIFEDLIIKSKFKLNSLFIFSSALMLFSLVMDDIFNDPNLRETIRYTLQGLSLMGLFLFSLTIRAGFIYTILNSSIVVFIGKISYTFYLIHMLIILSVKKLFNLEEIIPLLAITFPLCIIYSFLSYHYMEKPINKYKTLFSRI